MSKSALECDLWGAECSVEKWSYWVQEIVMRTHLGLVEQKFRRNMFRKSRVFVNILYVKCPKSLIKKVGPRNQRNAIDHIWEMNLAPEKHTFGICEAKHLSKEFTFFCNYFSTQFQLKSGTKCVYVKWIWSKILANRIKTWKHSHPTQTFLPWGRFLFSYCPTYIPLPRSNMRQKEKIGIEWNENARQIW